MPCSVERNPKVTWRVSVSEDHREGFMFMAFLPRARFFLWFISVILAFLEEIECYLQMS